MLAFVAVEPDFVVELVAKFVELVLLVFVVDVLVDFPFDSGCLVLQEDPLIQNHRKASALGIVVEILAFEELELDVVEMDFFPRLVVVLVMKVWVILLFH